MATEYRKVVFTAMSKRLFFFREHISVFVFSKRMIPINPFMQFGYFLLDRVDRDDIRNANNNLLERADELWVFGDISDGVLLEIILAGQKGMPMRFFSLRDSMDIVGIAAGDAALEPEARSLLDDPHLYELFSKALSR